MDMADFADINQQAMSDARIKTARNLSKDHNANIQGNGYCLECGIEVEQVNCKIKEAGDWVIKKIYPRWCCNICQKIWERDGN